MGFKIQKPAIGLAFLLFLLAIPQKSWAPNICGSCNVKLLKSCYDEVVSPSFQVYLLKNGNEVKDIKKSLANQLRTMINALPEDQGADTSTVVSARSNEKEAAPVETGFDQVHESIMNKMSEGIWGSDEETAAILLRCYNAIHVPKNPQERESPFTSR